MMTMDVYTSKQVKSVLRELGIMVNSETGQDFLCLCPFHGNRHTPAFSVSKVSGKFICFSPECGEAGSLTTLVRRLSSRNKFEAMRFITKFRTSAEDEFDDTLASLLDEPQEFEEFDQQVVDRLSDQMWQLSTGRDYMHSRGIKDDAIRDFQIGFSQKQNMVTVPVHSPDGLLLGMVGRSVEGKSFKNSPKLPKSKTVFNLHRAKRASVTAIVTEASFDAIRVCQAGFPGGVAILGGVLSPEQKYLLNRYFSRIVIMTDFDDKTSHMKASCRRCYPAKCAGHNPGRDLGMSIATSFPSKEILWASYDSGLVYPDGAKDVGAMNDDDIITCVRNAVSHFEYLDWGLY